MDHELLGRRFRKKFANGFRRLVRGGKLRLDGEWAWLREPQELEAWLTEVTQSNWNVFIEGPPHGKSRPAQVLKYLARYLTGEFDLPPAAGQLAEIDALKVWNRTFVTERPNRSHILNLHQLAYIDDLMDDMGLEKRRKPFIADQFVPYRSVDYAAVTAGTNPH